MTKAQFVFNKYAGMYEGKRDASGNYSYTPSNSDEEIKSQDRRGNAEIYNKKTKETTVLKPVENGKFLSQTVRDQKGGEAYNEYKAPEKEQEFGQTGTEGGGFRVITDRNTGAALPGPKRGVSYTSLKNQ